MAHRRLSIADLAKTLGMAPSTVSRALANNTQVSEATRKRVQALAAELHYQPNQLAAALRRGHSKTLGVLVPHLTGQFFPEVVNGIALEASRAGFNVMICQSNEDAGQEGRNLELLLNAQVEGILVSVANTTRSYTHFEGVRALGVPLVFFDRVAEPMVGDGVRTVLLDDCAGAYEAVAHLLRQGCRRIVHISGPLHLNIHKNRHQGYCDALGARGLPVLDELVCFAPDLTQQTGEDAMRYLLDTLPERPDAVFASTDLAAVGAMRVLKAHGLRIPEDVAVAGFSNELFTSLTEPPITSVDQRCQPMGELAVQTLLEMIGEAGLGMLPPAVILKPELLVRTSSLHAGAAEAA